MDADQFSALNINQPCPVSERSNTIWLQPFPTTNSSKMTTANIHSDTPRSARVLPVIPSTTPSPADTGSVANRALVSCGVASPMRQIASDPKLYNKEVFASPGTKPKVEEYLSDPDEVASITFNDFERIVEKIG